MSFEALVTLILVLPLVAAVLNGLNLLSGEAYYGWRTVQRVTCGALLFSFLGSIWVAYQIYIDPTPRHVVLYRWLASGTLTVDVAMMIDSLTVLMMLLVTGFSFLIAVFSINYMHYDFSFSRYFSALALFVFAMLTLVMGNNFVMLFFGWELVGLCSYLLIGHYYERVSAARAGTKAFVMNRVGDAGFLIGIFLIFVNFGTVNYAEVFAAAGKLDRLNATAITLCLLLGAIGKSAQLPLGTWLSKAMEGPTPSSALIHAATMVTAGIYMIVRAHSLFDMAPDTLMVITLVGAATAIYGTASGLAVSDIKGVLAFSTTTQLGLMFVACGLGAYAVAIFHLLAHAFFKSFLFLTAPSILHYFHSHPEPSAVDSDPPGVPIAFWLVLAGGVGLLATPIILGHTSTAAAVDSLAYHTLLAAGVIALFVTALYAVKIAQRIFSHHGHGHGHDEHHGEGHAAGAPGLLLLPLSSLAIVAVIGLALGLLPGGMTGSWFGEIMRPVVGEGPGAAPRPWASYVALGILGFVLLAGWATAIFLDRFKAELPGQALLRTRGLYAMALHRFWLDEFYWRYVVGTALALGRLLDRVDSQVVDRIVGAPVIASRIGSAGVTWETRVLAAKGAPEGVAGATSAARASQDPHRGERPDGGRDDVTGLAGWLTQASAGSTGWVEREVVARAPGFAGTLAATASGFSGSVERNLVGKASGVMGALAETASFVSSLVERDVIGGASTAMSGATDAAAVISGWVEHNVFDTGVNRSVVGSSSNLGYGLEAVEELMGRPFVVGAVLLACVAVVMLGVGS